MTKWSVGVLAISLVAVSILVALISFDPRPRNPSADEFSRLGLEPGMGRAAGIVVDKDEFLPEGATPHTYAGASVVISRAVEAGTYKISGEEPPSISYEAGELVAEVESEEHGYWQVDLNPGKYFVQAFYGESSYSENMLVNVEESAVLHLRLELLHGV